MNTMLKKLISASLVFAIALATVAPPRVFAQMPQTSEQPVISDPGRNATPTKTKTDLRKSLAVLSETKAGPLTTGDLKRIQQEQDNQPVNDQPKAGWSRKKKLLVALAIVLATGAFVVAYKHRCKDTPDKKCPEIDTTSSDY